MQLIQLNTWGGRVPNILDFVKQKSLETDIFCFQEINHRLDPQQKEVSEERQDLFDDLQRTLPEFTGFFSEQVSGIGIATFVKKTLNVGKVTSEIILTEKELQKLNSPANTAYYPRIVQQVDLVSPRFTIFNFHGTPGEEKRDNEKRRIQNDRLMSVIERTKGSCIMAGDFNLHLDTDAVRDIEKRMRNLMRDSGFSTTRSHFYTKKDTMPFADYIFINDGVSVTNFRVLSDVVSDHLPLQLTFTYA